MKSFSQLKKNLKNPLTFLKTIKIALLGDSATQFLSQAIRGVGVDSGFNLQIWEADFNQIERQVLDPSSELYDFHPDIVILFHSSHKLASKYSKLNPDLYSSLVDTQLQLISRLCQEIQLKQPTKIIYFNYPELDDSVFGNYASKVESSFLFQLRKLNYELSMFAMKTAGLYICDISSIQNQVGKSFMFQPSVYVNSEMVISIDALPLVATRTVDIIRSINGRFNKCLILDLDNTLWGGVIGDDGLEKIQLGNLGIGKAFTEFQYWIKKLKNRGIILAVCSKNTESVAREPFEKHPDMVLRLDDISIFVANWENKVDNIRKIQGVLNISFDSMVFLDDNPFERNIVRQNLPDITVPELPEDPADYLEFLYTQNLFETGSFSSADSERTEQYQVEARRASLQTSFINVDDFLKNLKMVSVIEPFNTFNTPRVAQLSQRSNQFNLRTVRYSDEDIKDLIEDPDFSSFSFTLKDQYGDNGLICIVILRHESNETVFIDTWLMSCRVLKRGMEKFTLNTIVGVARKKGYTFLKGEYIPTPKNGLVKDHYQQLGFESGETGWLLNLEVYKDLECFININ